jgi:predicted outer membrane lipoprotein
VLNAMWGEYEQDRAQRGVPEQGGV